MIEQETLEKMTKKDIRKSLRYNNQDLKRIAKGEAAEIMVMDYSYFYAIVEESKQLIQELRDRAEASGKDFPIREGELRESFHNHRYNAMKALEKKLGF